MPTGFTTEDHEFHLIKEFLLNDYQGGNKTARFGFWDEDEQHPRLELFRIKNGKAVKGISLNMDEVRRLRGFIDMLSIE